MDITAKKRDNTISIIKGVGIVLMVIGHSGCPEWLRNFIYMFHVPLFFITAGYFYKGCNDFSKLGTFIIKRFKGLYIPFVKWSLAFLILHNLFCSLDIYSTDIGSYNFRQLLSNGKNIMLKMTGNGQLLGAFWFLKTLLLASCCVSVIDFITHKITIKNGNTKRYILLFLFIISTVISKKYSISLPIIDDLSRICLGAAFFISGTIIKQLNISLKVYQVIAIFIIVLGVSIIQPCNMFTPSPILSIVFFTCSIITFLAIHNLIKFVKTGSSKMVYIGEHTMIILALHFLCFKLISLLKIYCYDYPIEDLSCFPVITDNNSFMWILYSIAGIAIPLLIEHIYIKIKSKIYEYTCNRSQRTVGK